MNVALFTLGATLFPGQVIQLIHLKKPDVYQNERAESCEEERMLGMTQVPFVG